MAVEHFLFTLYDCKVSVFPEMQIPFITFLLHKDIFWLQKTNSAEVV